MEAKYSYKFSKEEAPGIVEKMMAELRDNGKDIDRLSWKWNSKKTNLYFTVTAMGFNVKGEVSISNDEIKVSADLPFMAWAFSPDIKMAIDDAIMKVAPGKIEIV